MVNSIVQIESQNENNNSFGTGFVIDKDDKGIYVLTCQHVIDDVEIPVVDDLPTEIIVQSDFIDMAVLYITNLHLEPLPLQIDKCESREVDVIGFSQFNHNLSQKKHIIATLFKNTIELHSSEDDSFYFARKIKANDDYSFDRGNSGSPVICQKSGCVIAMISNKEGSDIAYAIEIASLEEVWKQLKYICEKSNESDIHKEFYNNLNTLKEKIEIKKEKLKNKKQKKEPQKKSPIKYYLAGILTVIVAYGIHLFLQSPKEIFKNNYKVINISSNDTLNVREDTGTVYKILGELPFNAKNIAVSKCIPNDAGKEWCKIQYGSLIGWVRSKYISVDKSQTIPEDKHKNYFRAEENNLFFQLTYPSSVKKGEPIMLTAILENHGEVEPTGSITLSFPQRPLLKYSVDYNNFETLTLYKIGESIYNNHKNQAKKMKAIHPLLEADSSKWKKGDINSFAITITPPTDFTSFKIRARASLTVNRPIPTDGTFDQQYFKSKEIIIPIVN